MSPDGLFQQCVEIDPAAPDQLEARLAAVPDKPAVFLLATADDEPVLLASGLAVRSILRRRLSEPLDEARPGQAPANETDRSQGEPETVESQRPGIAIPGRLPGDAGPARSRRADLRPIVRRLYLHPTCSPFETDLWYLWLARRLFPGRYRQMVRRRHCWMVHGDPADRTPRLVVTDRFTPAGGRRIGPIGERRSAARLVETLTALFRLCHHFQSPRQSPAGRACEYREMGRCTGPCDGTISLDEYRGQVAAALDFAADAGRTWRAEQTARMHAAAKALDFERAGRIKQQLARSADLDRPPYAWLGDAEGMDLLIVQPGSRKAELRTFRSFGGRLVVGPELTRKSPSDGLADWLRLPSPRSSTGEGDCAAATEDRRAASARSGGPPAADSAERAEEAGLLADYLFRGERDRGLFVRFCGQSAGELGELVQVAFPPPVPRQRRPNPAK